MFTKEDEIILMAIAEKLANALCYIGECLPSNSDGDPSLAILQASENIERGLDAVSRSLDLLTEAISNK